MAKVLIPTPLRQFADKHDSVQLSGGTVGEVLNSLTGQFQELRRQLYTDEGKLRSFVNVYLNDEDIRYLKKDATPVQDGDTISIVIFRGRQRMNVKVTLSDAADKPAAGGQQT